MYRRLDTGQAQVIRMFAKLQLDDFFAFIGVSIYAKQLARARIENFN